MGRSTRPEETQNLNGILCSFFLVMFLKHSVNLIIPSDKLPSAVPAAAAELFNLLSLPPLIILLYKVTTY